MTIPVLALTGISKRFGLVRALSDVDLEVKAGEVVALVGESGMLSIESGAGVAGAI